MVAGVKHGRWCQTWSLVSNMVDDEKAEKQTGNNGDAMFKKSRWSDQKRPN
jgi:hypothetical protein